MRCVPPINTGWRSGDGALAHRIRSANRDICSAVASEPRHRLVLTRNQSQCFAGRRDSARSSRSITVATFTRGINRPQRMPRAKRGGSPTLLSFRSFSSCRLMPARSKFQTRIIRAPALSACPLRFRRRLNPNVFRFNVRLNARICPSASRFPICDPSFPPRVARACNPGLAAGPCLTQTL